MARDRVQNQTAWYVLHLKVDQKVAKAGARKNKGQQEGILPQLPDLKYLNLLALEFDYLSVVWFGYFVIRWGSGDLGTYSLATCILVDSSLVDFSVKYNVLNFLLSELITILSGYML